MASRLSASFLFSSSLLLLIGGVGSVLTVPPALRATGFISLASSLGLAGLISAYLLSKQPRIPKHTLGFTICMLMFLLWNLILAALFHQLNGFERVAQIALIITTIIFFSRCASETGKTTKIIMAYGAYLLLIVLFSFSLIPKLITHSAINPNGPGLISLAFAAFIPSLTLHKNNTSTHFILPLFISLFITWNFGARAALLALITFSLVYAWLRFMPRNRIVSWAPFVSVLSAQALFVLMYLNPKESGISKTLNKISFYLFEGSAMSGRDKIWPQVINLIQQSPLIGHGPGAKLSDFTDIKMSAHNLFFQVGFQAGSIGLILLIFALIFLYIALLTSHSEEKKKIGPAFLVSIIFVNLFNVSLTQNMFFYGIMFWVILAINLEPRYEVSPTSLKG